MSGSWARAQRRRSSVAPARPAVAGALAAWALALLVVFAASPLACANFTVPMLLSGSSELQFDHANAPALAGGGRYVVFQGSLAGVSGVYRRDLDGGTVEPVAVADPGDPAISAPDAAAPSVSADGQYVAFTTTADLEPEHVPAGGGRPEGEPAVDAGCPEVYVRNMQLPASAPGAYTLVAAVNGGGQGIVFAGGCPPAKGGFAIAGAQAAPAVAMSADGRSVVFTVLSASDLASAGAQAGTPPSQVAVRDLATQTTTLVSATPAGAPTSGGGAYPSEQAERHLSPPTSSETPIAQEEVTDSTAAISGDGSTVAWLGTNVPAQVPGSAAEIEADTYHETEARPAANEVEPLWRRVADGPSAFTRRLMAGAGLDMFYSPEEPGEIVTAGTLVGTLTVPAFVPPALSENGESVALISNAPRPPAVRSVELVGKIPTTDAYLVHADDDPAAAVRVTPLTETPNYDATPAALGYIANIAISPGGGRVAFDAQRTEFVLPSLALVSPPVSYTDDGEIYEANLTLGTLQRVSATYDGAQPTGAAGLLAFGENERLLAFASRATNLFYGDAVKAPEVYLTEEASSEVPAATEGVGVAPEEPLPHGESRLDATAVALPDGRVRVHARTPGAGTLTVAARSQLPGVGTAQPAKHSRATRRSRARRGRSVSAARVPRLLDRTVGRAVGRVRASGELTLTVSIAAPYRSLVDGRGLYAVLRVSFAAPGRRSLVAEIPVTFHRVVRARRTANRRGHGARS